MCSRRVSRGPANLEAGELPGRCRIARRDSHTVIPMRWRLLLLVALSATACSQPGTDPTTTGVSAPSAGPTTTIVEGGPIRGALPNGADYDIGFPTPHDEQITDIHAEVAMDYEGSRVPLTVRFLHERPTRVGPGVRYEAGQWTVEILLPDSLDAEAREVVTDAVEVSTEVGMPVMDLEQPLSWSAPPRVDYDRFSVVAGCPDEAMACNATQAVSVVPHPDEAVLSGIIVQSYTLRPVSDPNYLPPGPLEARWWPDVVWTGKEMVVWGGSSQAGPPHLTGGAAFDPAGDEWRLLSPPPLRGDQATRAIWTGSHMVVVAEEATLAWEPVRDEWEVIGEGEAPPLDPRMIVNLGSDVAMWSAEGIYRLDSRGAWRRLPDPRVGDPGLDGSVLRAIGSELFAIGQDGCDRIVARLRDGEWDRLTRISLDASPPMCGRPNQSAVVGKEIVFWDDTSGGVVTYDPGSDTLTESSALPLPAMDAPPGPLHLDSGFLVTADLRGAIYDPDDDLWTRVDLPGLGSDVDMVWTGEEVLMWAKCCYGPDDVDAWRWSPPG